MCQVVAYRRVKTIENSKTVSCKSGRDRLREVIVYHRVHLIENIFGVLGRWSHVEVHLYLVVSQKRKQKVVLNPKGSYSVACKRKLQKNLTQQICTWHSERD